MTVSSFLRSSAQIVWGSATLSLVSFFVEGKEEGLGHLCINVFAQMECFKAVIPLQFFKIQNVEVIVFSSITVAVVSLYYWYSK